MKSHLLLSTLASPCFATIGSAALTQKPSADALQCADVWLPMDLMAWSFSWTRLPNWATLHFWTLPRTIFPTKKSTKRCCDYDGIMAATAVNTANSNEWCERFLAPGPGPGRTSTGPCLDVSIYIYLCMLYIYICVCIFLNNGKVCALSIVFEQDTLAIVADQLQPAMIAGIRAVAVKLFEWFVSPFVAFEWFVACSFRPLVAWRLTGWRSTSLWSDTQVGSLRQLLGNKLATQRSRHKQSQSLPRCGIVVYLRQMPNAVECRCSCFTPYACNLEVNLDMLRSI